MRSRPDSQHLPGTAVANYRNNIDQEVIIKG